jgi:hypothetical protein
LFESLLEFLSESYEATGDFLGSNELKTL